MHSLPQYSQITSRHLFSESIQREQSQLDKDQSGFVSHNSTHASPCDQTGCNHDF